MSTELSLAEFGTAVERELSFLRHLGFAFTGAGERDSAALGTYLLEAEFTNATVNRIVNVTYLPAHAGPRTVATTRIWLIVPEPVDDFAYTTTDSMRVCATDLSASEGSPSARFADHLQATVQALREQFMEVLAGRAWSPDHLDWGGLK
jgi:hypothetical protein